MHGCGNRRIDPFINQIRAASGVSSVAVLGDVNPPNNVLYVMSLNVQPSVIVAQSSAFWSRERFFATEMEEPRCLYLSHLDNKNLQGNIVACVNSQRISPGGNSRVHKMQPEGGVSRT